ncbi:MAG: fibronectin type III domain-containing protein [Solirubrobacteraceae bacterium]|nr:fibronectin type III domain-containing protein [Solirubrobacteraceae bacterium]
MSRPVQRVVVWHALRTRALLVLSLLLAVLGAAPAAHAERSTLSSGERQTCVVRAADQGVSCWGAYRLSTLSESDKYSKPIPTDVPGAGPARSVATGRLGYQCAVRQDGTVGCWGAGLYTNTDLGITFEVPTVKPVEDATGSPISTYVDAAVNDREGCAVRASGAVDCWRPEGVAKPISGLSDATSVTSNGVQFCARRSSGRVSCWDRGLPRLADTVEAPAVWTTGAVATEVPGITDAVTVSGLCALRVGGVKTCWSITHRPKYQEEYLAFGPPLDDASITDVADLAVGATHLCAQTKSGTVLCNGSNSDGQFGLGLVELPAARKGPDGTEVSVTGSSSCVRLIDATVRCSGNARRLSDGVLGNPSRPAGDNIRPIGYFSVARSQEPRPVDIYAQPIIHPEAPLPVAPAPYGDATPNSLVVRWDPPAAGFGVQVAEYLVRYGTSEIAVPASQTQLQINGLTPDTDYAITVSANGSNSLESAPLTRTYRTLPQVVLGVPNFGDPDVTDTSVTVHWQPTGNAIVDGFRLVLDDHPSVTVGANARSYAFTGLEPESEHTILLSALSPEGNESAPALQVVATSSSATPTPTPTPTPTVVTPTPTPTATPISPSAFAVAANVTGSTTIKSLSRTPLPLTGTLAVRGDLRTAPVTADLVLNDTQARSTALGFLPVTLSIGFVSSASATGSRDNGLHLAAKLRIKVRSVKAFGAIPIAGGNSCQTKQLSTVPLDATSSSRWPDGGFAVTLAGSYAIGDLNGCGFFEGLVSPLVASTGNTMSLALTSRP